MHRADGSFYCGTAAEIVGLESLDDVPFKLRWEDTFGYVIQQAYKNLVREQKDADINLVASTDLIDPITIGAEVSDASALLSVNSTEVE
jgi:branched-chain amino acid aminotransferase